MALIAARLIAVASGDSVALGTVSLVTVQL